MTTYTITSGHDTYANSLAPTGRFGAANLVFVSASTGFPAYVYLPLPAELAGQTVASATLTAHAWNVPSAVTASVYLTTSPWADATLTYNRQPTHGATHVDTAVPIVAADAAINLDVSSLVQSVASGQAWYGFYLTATGIISLRSFESGALSWVLTIVTTEAPQTPQSLVPNGTTVAQPKPTLTCDFVDNGGISNLMGAIQVQIDPAQNATTPAFDSGTVSSTLPLLDLTTTAYAGLADGASTFWRVRVQDTSGLWSGWSDWAGFTYRSPSTITLFTPAAGVLWDPTTVIVAGTSHLLSAYRVQITDGNDRTNVRFDTGRIPAPGTSPSVQVSLPENYDGHRVLVDDRDYQLHIRVWDTFTNRQATPGSPDYVESWTTFHFDDDLTVTPVDTLTADSPDPSPAVQLTWTRASAPDAWVILRDSKVIARVDPVDTLAGVSTWSWTDPHPAPWVEHNYNVKPLSGGKQGDPGPVATITPDGLGVWLYTQDGQHLAIDGADTSQLTQTTRMSTYKPLNVRYDVDIVTGFEGLSGVLTNGIIPSELDDTMDVSDAEAVLQSIKDNPGKSVRLIFGMFSAEVLLRNISITPSPLGNPATPLQTVSFGVNQVGDFD